MSMITGLMIMILLAVPSPASAAAANAESAVTVTVSDALSAAAAAAAGQPETIINVSLSLDIMTRMTRIPVTKMIICPTRSHGHGGRAAGDLDHVSPSRPGMPTCHDDPSLPVTVATGRRRPPRPASETGDSESVTVPAVPRPA